MSKFPLDEHMKDTVEYFRGIEYLSLYGILSGINSENSGNKEFYYHGQKVLVYFNDFDNKTDDDNFMKCLLGDYEVVETVKTSLTRRERMVDLNNIGEEVLNNFIKRNGEKFYFTINERLNEIVFHWESRHSEYDWNMAYSFKESESPLLDVDYIAYQIDKTIDRALLQKIRGDY